jgi:hypothetical protein
MKYYMGLKTWTDSLEWPKQWKIGIRFQTWNKIDLRDRG